MARRRNIYEMNYARLQAILGQPPELLSDEVYRLRSEGFMDLFVESLLPCEVTGAPILSLAHYFKQNGDLCQDPDMTIRIFPPNSTNGRLFAPSTTAEHGRIEACSFQQAIPPIYHEVYPSPGMILIRVKEQLNLFLATWLRNLKDQGHRLVTEAEVSGDG